MEKEKSLVDENGHANSNPEDNSDRESLPPELEAEYLNWVRTDVHVANVDNHYLKPLAGGPFAIGCVDEVNGAGAKEIPQFLATRHELIELVKYWTKRALDSEFWVFLTGQIGSTDMRVRPFAYRRISRIADVIGEDEIRKVVDEAKNEFGKSQDAKAWDIFLHGMSEQRQQFQAEFYSQLEKRLIKRP